MAETITIRNEHMRERVLSHISALNIEKEWDITIEPHVKKRSLNQNNLFHKWNGIMADYAGVSHAQMKTDLKDEFAPLVESNINPEKFRAINTSDMSVGQMKEFMDKIYIFATSEWGLLLPVPEDTSA